MTTGAVRHRSPRAARHLARLRRHWPWLAVVGTVAIGLLVMYLDHWRRGLFTIGVASLLGAVFRAVLPARRVALLVVRSRAFDVATLVTLGLVIMVLSAVIPTLPR
jgi:hypothetical protein